MYQRKNERKTPMKPIKQMLDISSGPDFAFNGQRSIMKTQIASPAAFSNLRRVTSMTALANAVFLCGAVLSMSGAAIARIQEKSASHRFATPG